MEQLVELRVWTALTIHPKASGFLNISIIALRTAGELL
jgi:hypothetical protein